MMEILRRVEAHTGCATLVAYAWFRSEPLPGLDGTTPHQLVRRLPSRVAVIDDERRLP